MVSLDKDLAKEIGREVVSFVPDVVHMLRAVVADDRVPAKAKAEAGATLAYLLSPRNRITSLIPVVGQLDDVAVVAFALRRLLIGAGEPLLREHWRGSERGFQTLMRLSAALATPKGMFRGIAMVGSLATAVNGPRRRPPGRRGGRVIDGEVLDGDPPDGPDPRWRKR